MTYNEFQEDMAQRDFLATPIDEAQFCDLLAMGCDDDEITGFACDVGNGWELEVLTADLCVRLP